jgi:hypothetical protein
VRKNHFYSALDSFSRSQLNGLIDLAEVGLKEAFAAQQVVLAL